MKLLPILFICTLSISFPSFGMELKKFDAPSLIPTELWHGLHVQHVPSLPLTAENLMNSIETLGITLTEIRDMISRRLDLASALRKRVVEVLEQKNDELGELYGHIHSQCSRENPHEGYLPYMEKLVPQYWHAYHARTEPAIRKLLLALENAHAPESAQDIASSLAVIEADTDNPLIALENLTL